MIQPITESKVSNILIKQYKGRSILGVAQKLVDIRHDIVPASLNQSLFIQHMDLHHAAILFGQNNMVGMIYTPDNASKQLQVLKDYAEDTNIVYAFSRNNVKGPGFSFDLFINNIEQIFEKSKIFSVDTACFSNAHSPFESSVLAKDYKIYVNGYHQVAEYNHG